MLDLKDRSHVQRLERQERGAWLFPTAGDCWQNGRCWLPFTIAMAKSATLYVLLGSVAVTFWQVDKAAVGPCLASFFGVLSQPPGACFATGRTLQQPLRVCTRKGVQLLAADAAAVPAKAGKAGWSWNLFAWCAVVFLSLSDCAAFSAVVGLIILRRWKRRGSLQVERGSMAHFAWRGATIGVVLSILLQVLFVPVTGLLFPELAFFLVKSGAAGAVEELGKFLSLIWLSWSGLNPFRPKLESRLPQKKGLVLAGFSLGVGFMVVENGVYSRKFQSIFQFLAQRASETGDDALMGFAVWSGVKFLLCRIFLNPHPYLTGISAGRFAKIAGDLSQRQRLTAKMLFNVLWPSAILHALSNLSGGLLVRIFCFMICTKVFADTWNSLAEPDGQSESGQEL